MDASVTWHHGMTFTGTADTGFTVPLGATPKHGGDNDGFRPLELMAVSLAGCTAMDVISLLQKKRQQVTGFEVRVQTERATDHPRVFTKVHVEYIVTGKGIDEAALERSIELSETKYCPAQALLSKAIAITHSHQILEAE
jgi:putative redox protein